MTLAYVLCAVKSGHEKETMEFLANLDQVSESYIVYGEYDIVFKVVVNTPDELRVFLTNSIRNIGPIERTTTLLAV